LLPVLIDSSVLIALLDQQDKHHKKCVEKILNDQVHINAATISITECLIRPFKLESYFAYLVLSNLNSIVDKFHELTQSIAIDAANVRALKNLSTADSIILATALSLGSPLWSCDKKLVSADRNTIYVGDLN
jgi:predicted nucleic acid-binding protein